MKLRDDDITLRTYRTKDNARLAELANNPNVARYLTGRFPQPYTLKDANEWITLTAKEKTRCNFAIEHGEEFVGGIGIEPLEGIFSCTAEVGYWLGEPYWGKGIATRALRLLVEYAFNELLFVRLQARVFTSNPTSARVLEKTDFLLEGTLRKLARKNGQIHDCHLYARLRNP